MTLLIAEILFFSSFIIHIPVLWLRKKESIPDLVPDVVQKLVIVIPTYNEPLEILRQTIRAALEVEVPDKIKLKVVVLDDGHRDWLRDFVTFYQKMDKIPLEYVARTERTGYKAGNINNYLQQSQEDFLLCLDADFRAEPDILVKFLPYMGQDSVGFVQAPQYFDNIESSDPYGQDAELWFSLLQMGRYGQDALICCGSPTLWSIPALREIGGLQHSVTEDFLSGVTLQTRGYKAFYLQERVAVGIASDDSIDVRRKTVRYAAGAFEFIKLHTGLVMTRKLSLVQQFLHATYPIAFIAPLAAPVLILIPIISILTGISPFVLDESGQYFLGAQLISLISLQSIFLLAVGRKSWRSWQYYWGMFPAYYEAFMTTFFGRLKFAVSKKGGPQISGWSQLLSVKWQILFLLAGWSTLGYGLLTFNDRFVGVSLYPSFAWLLLNNLLLFGVVRAPLRSALSELIEAGQENWKSLQRASIAIALVTVAIALTPVFISQPIFSQFQEAQNTPDQLGQPIAQKMTASLGQLNTQLDLQSEQAFSSLLFFIDWRENSVSAGSKQFEHDVAPVLDLAYENGMIPIITWEPVKKNAQGEFAQDFKLASIRDGQSDLYLQGWREGLQKWMSDHPGYEVRIRLMHEMNAPIQRYHWSNVSPAEYRASYEYIYEKIAPVSEDVKWMLVFQNFTADAGWQQKRAKDYEQYSPNVDIDYVGIDGYSRPFLNGVDGPIGGEVTPAQVLPEAFFRRMRELYPTAGLVISETSVPYMPATDEPVPYPSGKVSYQMTDPERAAWISELQSYVVYLDQKYTLAEVTWFNGNTDYHWSLDASEDQLTVQAFKNFMQKLKNEKIGVGIYPGE
jgi:cellulose synthase/poly-beta-1,6-N-acetylglucosamine synthase-like glycosyltransferase